MDREKLVKQINACWPSGAVVATTHQLGTAGCGDRQLTQAVDMRVLFRLRRGAYVRAASWLSLTPWEQEKMRLWAHIVSVPGNHAYSHFSAARLHGLSVWNCGSQVHLTCKTSPTGVGVARDVTFHELALGAVEEAAKTLGSGHSVLVTSLERTVVDCARIGGFVEAVIIGDNALYKGADLELMKSMVESLAGKPGAKKARRVLAALNRLSESPGESRTRLFLAEMDIPVPVLQLWIKTNLASYRADFAWPEIKLILEFDGKSKYYDFRPTAEVLRDERRRESLLIEQGWRVIRIDWNDLSTPDELRRRILAAVAAATQAVRWAAA